MLAIGGLPKLLIIVTMHCDITCPSLELPALNNSKEKDYIMIQSTM